MGWVRLSGATENVGELDKLVSNSSFLMQFLQIVIDLPLEQRNFEFIWKFRKLSASLGNLNTGLLVNNIKHVVGLGHIPQSLL